jgi:hypothetical protein
VTPALATMPRKWLLTYAAGNVVIDRVYASQTAQLAARSENLTASSCGINFRRLFGRFTHLVRRSIAAQSDEGHVMNGKTRLELRLGLPPPGRSLAGNAH